MSWRDLFLAAAASVALVGCGFQPIAATTSVDRDTARLPLRTINLAIDIDRDERRFEYLLRQAFDQSVIIDRSAANALVIDVDVDQEGLAIQQNDSVTRFNLTATANYSIVDGDGKELLDGATVSITALNTTASQFSTSVSQRDALRRLATDLSNRIVTLLRLHYSNAALSQ